MIPVLLTASGGSDDDAGSTAAAREGRVRFVVEGYLRVLALNPAMAPANVAEETFGYADVLRGQSVQRALQASSARAATDKPELAKLVRASQDGEKQIGAAVATLNNLLTLPPAEREEKALKATQAEIAALQAARAQTLKEIARKFPEYGNLVNPPPPGAADIQKQLADDEALLSFYFGRFDSFVWVLRKDSPVQFSRIKMTHRRPQCQGHQAARGAGAESGDDFGYSAVRREARVGALWRSAQECRERLEAGEKPDRRDQRRAWAVAVVAVADRAGGGKGRRRSACLRAIATCRGLRGRMP